ncbi:hypothetical protein SSS_01737 [Sarcoptes scabiei]|uniref:Uncharacterized protein n=1 Tax=Sarcoptes scabiei TaxID=52283 RepID=A0A132AEQ5_SARSC|nr:hypothetical protein SSS_01737 [Sarcoptes scabiei]KPM09035.1 hypothetical protein QR98_0075640 [Sarcoptes scabiei]
MKTNLSETLSIYDFLKTTRKRNTRMRADTTQMVACEMCTPACVCASNKRILFYLGELATKNFNCISIMMENNVDVDENNNHRPFLLIRVPKSLKLEKLDGLKVYLENSPKRQRLIDVQGENDERDYHYSYEFTPITNQSSVNIIQSTSNGEFRLNRNDSLRGYLNFYKRRSSTLRNEFEIEPLIPINPNDPVEDIINQNQRHRSIKKRTKMKKISCA